jgi:hypothetical protein
MYGIDGEHKRCSRCRRWLHVSEYARKSSTEDGLQRHCRACSREYALLRRYGLSHEQYEQMVEAQQSMCRVCGKPLGDPPRGRLHFVDHCHRTGRVRGIVHAKCNMLVGVYETDPNVFDAVKEYVESHAE